MGDFGDDEVSNYNVYYAYAEDHGVSKLCFTITCKATVEF